MTLIIAHRGASNDRPENTVDAFTEAVEQGADWVELDVRMDRDGALVVHHDGTFANGDVICDTASDSWPEGICDLAAAMEACGGIGVNVEIKNSPHEPGYDTTGALVERTLDVIAGAPGVREVLITSFDLDTINRVREAPAAPPTGYLVMMTDEPDDAVTLALDGGHVAVNPWNPGLTEAAAERVLDAGLDLNVWTVDDPERLQQLASWGVTGLITNRPAFARAALAGR